MCAKKIYMVYVVEFIKKKTKREKGKTKKEKINREKEKKSESILMNLFKKNLL